MRSGLLLLVGILFGSASTIQIDDLEDVQDHVVICKGAISIAESVSGFGSVISGAAVSIASRSTIVGDIDVVGALSIGADARVTGLTISEAAITLGAESWLIGDVYARSEITLGAHSSINGSIRQCSTLTVGDGASVSGTIEIQTNDGPTSQDTQALDAIQSAYTRLQSLGNASELNNAIHERTLLPGVYSHSGPWTLPVGQTLRFKGDHADVWILQIDGAVSIAGLVELFDGADPFNIQWSVTGTFSCTTDCYGSVFAMGAK